MLHEPRGVATRVVNRRVLPVRRHDPEVLHEARHEQEHPVPGENLPRAHPAAQAEGDQPGNRGSNQGQRKPRERSIIFTDVSVCDYQPRWCWFAPVCVFGCSTDGHCLQTPPPPNRKFSTWTLSWQDITSEIKCSACFGVPLKS